MVAIGLKIDTGIGTVTIARFGTLTFPRLTGLRTATKLVATSAVSGILLEIDTAVTTKGKALRTLLWSDAYTHLALLTCSAGLVTVATVFGIALCVFADAVASSAIVGASTVALTARSTLRADVVAGAAVFLVGLEIHTLLPTHALACRTNDPAEAFHTRSRRLAGRFTNTTMVVILLEVHTDLATGCLTCRALQLASSLNTGVAFATGHVTIPTM